MVVAVSYFTSKTNVGVDVSIGGHPGLLRFAPLRPYNIMERVQVRQNMQIAHVGAQWSEAQ
jgi:hypothetical protein